jgi:hypothetical protein
MKLFGLPGAAILLTLIFVAPSLSGQDVKERTVNNAENKANNRIDTRVDEGLDKSIEAIEGLFKRKNKKKKDDPALEEQATEKSNNSSSSSKESSSNGSGSSSGYNGGAMSGLMTPAVIASEYSFDLVFDVQVSTTKKNGKVQEMTNQMMFSPGVYAMNPDMEKGDQEAKVIFDMKNESMVMLETKKGKRSGMAMNMNRQFWSKFSDTMQQGMADPNAGVTKTGRTKTILGKLCSEYTFKNEDMEGSAWVADFDGYNAFELAEFINVDVQETSMTKNGFAMESNTKHFKSGETTSWKVTKVNENANLNFDMSDWQVKDVMGNTY